MTDSPLSSPISYVKQPARRRREVVPSVADLAGSRLGDVTRPGAFESTADSVGDAARQTFEKLSKYCWGAHVASVEAAERFARRIHKGRLIMGSNEAWAFDFVQDAAESGKEFHVLRVIDVMERRFQCVE